jgi:predicted dehydrogenase
LTTPLRIGLVGCGNVCESYLGRAGLFPGLRFVACADLRREAAEATAQAHGLYARSLEDLLASDDIDVVLNLTIPAAHAEVALAAIALGKHVYLEKPLATQLADGRRILHAAAARGVRVGCAPDTVLGAGVQTARSLIDSGAIGTPILGSSTSLSSGVERFHPHPAPFYQAGGGPVFDRAPYDIGALVTLLGPVGAVTASGQTGHARRTITAPTSPRRGEQIKVEVFTSVQGVLDFERGGKVTFMGSWDAWRTDMPLLEIHGTEGSISVPDPNWFGGAVKLSREGAPWRTFRTEGLPTGRPNIALQNGGKAANYRGLGLAEMAQAIEQGRPHRASGEFALHLLAVMEALIESAMDQHRVEVTDRCQRPQALSDAQAQTLLECGAGD